MTYDAPFDLNAKVHIDGDSSIVGVVTCLSWRVENPQIEVCWWVNGAQNHAWFSPWRLSAA